MTIPENDFTLSFKKEYGDVQLKLLINTLEVMLGGQNSLELINLLDEKIVKDYRNWEEEGLLRKYDNNGKGYLKFVTWMFVVLGSYKSNPFDTKPTDVITFGMKVDPDIVFAFLELTLNKKKQFQPWFDGLFDLASKRPDFTHPVLEICLIFLILNRANYYTGDDNLVNYSCGTFENLKSFIEQHPYNILSRIVYHDAIIHGYYKFSKYFKEQNIKLKLDRDLIYSLIPEPLSKSQCLGFKKNIECSQINNFLDQDEVDCIMNILNGRTLTYSTLEYPPILTKFLQGVGSSKKSPPTLNELIASLYMQLDIYKDMFDKFFVNRSFAVLREPIESSLKSLEEFLLPHNRSEVLRYFSEQPLNPNPTTEGPILELCSIAMHPDLPKEMQSKVIQLIDEISSLKIQAVKVIKLESSGSIDKTLPQTSLSFFDKPSSNNSLASKQEESQYPRHG
ncbi:hypothetical protein [Legionella sp. W05-934-2]|uniref:hypothetical protein n=1 Tax=Legionella sp. W05-934-2 TaxID=1198649 RepID=UPI003462AA89